MKNFFISYTKVDREWAEWIGWQLEETGYSVVIQAWDFRPGGNFVLDMQRVMSEAERTIAVLSPEYLSSGFAAAEWAAAFAQDPTGERGILLPVRVRDCVLSGLFPQIVYIDLVGKSGSQAKEILLDGVKRERAKPALPPVFPTSFSTHPKAVTRQPQFPGALPPIWSIPHQRNPNFIGRSELLDDLRNALTTGRKAVLTQAIVGLGGIGKTQLAVEYAYHHAASYRIVWWIRAEDAATIVTDYVALASALGLSEEGRDDLDVVVQSVRRWLNQNTKWLLIFDNADAPGNLYNYLPQSRTGHILITSRNQTWSEIASKLQVPVLERNKSVEFLLFRTGQKDRNVANELAEELGDFPLALEHASAYIDTVGGISLADYLDLFRTRRQALMERAEPPLGYHATVATTWELSFQEVQRKSLAAAELISLNAFLASDRIPRWLLGQEPHPLAWELFTKVSKAALGLRDETLNKYLSYIRVFLKARRALRSLLGLRSLPRTLDKATKDKLVFNDAVVVLHRYSLIELFDDKTWLIHRLVQAVSIDRQTESEKKRYAKMAVRLIEDSFPKQVDIATWPVCAQLLPHALAAAMHAEMLQVAPIETGSLLNGVGVYFMQTARFTEAKDVLERALKILEGTFGPKHRFLASSLNNLGALMESQGDYEGAQLYIERAFNIGRKGLGRDPFQTPTRLGNLGEVRRQRGDLAGARSCYERALKMAEATYGPYHIQVAGLADNLGLVLQDQGDLKDARANIERALTIFTSAYGPDHPDVAIAHNNLGRVLAQQGDIAGAKRHAECALKILRKTLGDDHPSTKVTENNLKFAYGLKSWRASRGGKTKKNRSGRRKR